MGNVKIISASAGSGKTYRLAYEYVRAVVEDPTQYRRILAVTFTNKATEEMKSRILSELDRLASGADSPYLADLEHDLGLTGETVRARAAQCRTKILHDYGRFNVLTIDKFFQRIIRSFIRELGLDMSYTLELQTDSILESAADRLIESIRNDDKLRRWIMLFVEDRIAQNQRWDVRSELVELGSEIFRERFARGAEPLPREEIGRIVAVESARVAKIRERMQALAGQVLNVISEASLSADDFMGKGNSFVSYLRDVNEGGLKPYTKRVTDALESDEKWAPKTSPRKAEIMAIAPRLRELLGELTRMYDENITAINTTSLVQENFRAYALLTELALKAREVCAEMNIVPISETNDIIGRLIGGNDAPFIYEKTGGTISRYMIDEFQDTSLRQWENFVPLLENALSQSPSSPVLLVGDVKQSIYRWRGGDWQILGKLAPETFRDTEIFNLDTNYRSAETIVKFNNSMISEIVRLADHNIGGIVDEFRGKGVPVSRLEPFEGILSAAYAGHSQNFSKDAGKGYVRITEIPKGGAGEAGDAPGTDRGAGTAYAAEDMARTEARVSGDTGGAGAALGVSGAGAAPAASIAHTTPVGHAAGVAQTGNASAVGATLTGNTNMAPAAALTTTVPAGTRSLLIETVESLQRRGYAPGDIAILVRYNRQGSEIAQELLDYKASNPDSPFCYDLVTQEALTLGNSPVVNFIVSAMELAVRPDNSIRKAVYNRFLGRGIDAEFGGEESLFLHGLRLVSIEEAFERILSHFSLGKRTADIAYIQALHNHIHGFSASKIADIPIFLKWWEESGRFLSVNVPSDRSAIGILTIHKAKGLQYKAVIIPECSWKLGPKTNSLFWATAGEGPFRELGKVPLRWKNMVADSYFAGDYLEELVLSHVDNINTFYVAATRTEEELHIFIPEGQKAGVSIAGLVFGAIERVAEDTAEGKADGEAATEVRIGEMIGKAGVHNGCRVYEFGMPYTGENMAVAERPAQAAYYSARRVNPVRFSTASSRYFEDEGSNMRLSPRNYGIVMHRVFENINSVGDIDTELEKMHALAEISDEERSAVAGLIRESLADETIRSWFDPSWDTVRNEANIIVPRSHGLKRPDRVITKGNRAVVVDYKFGTVKKDSYAAQIRRYMELLGRMGYREVTGYIWYISLRDVVEV